jgi:hypothetical protein
MNGVLNYYTTINKHAYREGESEHLDLKLIFPQKKYSLSNRDRKQSSQEMMKTLIMSE